MKIARMTALFIVAVIFLMPASAQNKSPEQLVVPLTEPGKPYKLDVHLMNGSIKITAYDGKDIIIDAQSDIDSSKEEKENDNSNGMKRIPGSVGMDLTAEEKNNNVTIHSQSFMRIIKLAIKIPRGATSLNLGTISNGDIEVTNASGDMEISNVSGKIQLTGVSGSVVANTVDGNVIVTFKSINATAPMAFSTLSGNVDVSFPAAIKANVKLKTDMGEMFTDFDIVVDKTETKTSRSESGMYHLKVEDWIHGKINGGGPEIMMKTMTGNIYIRKPKS